MRRHYVTDLTQYDGERTECPEEQANLVSSLTPGGMHAPVIDLDFPCRLVESTTPGHFHLYLDREVSWDRYCELLHGFHAAGLIEDGFYRLSLHRGATFVRKPGVLKQPGDVNSAAKPGDVNSAAKA